MVTKNVNSKGSAAKVATGKVEIPHDELSGRPIIYPEITADIEDVTAQAAKEMMGWESESEHETRLTADVSPEKASIMNVKYGAEYNFTDYNGEKVRCSNNVRNRPMYQASVDQIAQDILNDNWRLNGESWVIGQSGLALSLQHRAFALIRAEQVRSYDGEDEDKLAKARHWQGIYPSPLSIEAVVVRGIKETPDVTRTLDNVRPRSLSDVLFADTSLFNKTAKAAREKLCRITDWAIRTVWYRTGCSDDAFSPKRTHSESLEFLTRHPRLLKAVAHLYTETNRKNSEGVNVDVLSKYITPGTAAGLMFLMGCSSSDRARWDGADSPNDRHLDFERWEKAELFWAGIADASDNTFEPIRKAIFLCGNSDTGAVAPVPVKIAVLVNAWNEYIDDNGMLTVKRIQPEFAAPDEEGRRALVGMPSVGGIDIGDPKEVRRVREEEEAAQEAAQAAEDAELAAQEAAEAVKKAPVEKEPTAKEKAAIAQRAQTEKEKHMAAKADTAAPVKKGLRGGTASK